MKPMFTLAGGWPSRPSPRHGYTLVELTVVISINSVLMAVAVGLLGTLMRTEQAAQRHWIQTATPARLAAQFRSDVAAAKQAILVSGNVAAGANQPPGAQRTVLRLHGPDDRVIEFHRDGEYLRRIESRGSTVLRREAYTVPNLSEATFILPDGQSDANDNGRDAAKLVTITLRFAAEPHSRPGDWQITAQLAKDLRFAAGDQAPGESE